MENHGKKANGKPDTVKTNSPEDVKKKYPDDRIKQVGVTKDDVVHLRCAGMDVHKSLLVVAACITDVTTMKPNFYIYKLNQTTSEIREMMAWLKSLDIVDVCMESTGKYSLPLFWELRNAGFKPVMANPKYVHSVRGQKTDVRDAMHIAEIFRMGLVTPSFIPPQEVQDLRDCARYRRKLVEDRAKEKNRLQNALTVNSVRLGNVLSDVFGKTGRAIINYLVTTPQEEVKDDAIIRLIDKKCRRSPEEILNSIRGFHIDETQRIKILSHLKHLDLLDEMINITEKEMRDIGHKHFEKQIINLQSIPTFKDITVLSIIGEVGVDMSYWSDVKHFTSWNSTCPANNASAGKKKSTKIGLGGLYIKPVLVECAINASKAKTPNYFGMKYWKIASRRGKKKANIAVARMMLEAVYYILRDDVLFCPRDADATLRKGKATEEKQTRKLQYVFDTLRANGVDEDTLKKVMDQCSAAQQEGSENAKEIGTAPKKLASEGEKQETQKKQEDGGRPGSVKTGPKGQRGKKTK